MSEKSAKKMGQKASTLNCSGLPKSRSRSSNNRNFTVLTPRTFPVPTIFVSVTKSMRRLIPGVLANTPVVDCARGCWLVDSLKANQCEMLVAVDNDYIIDVWQIDRSFPWRYVTPNAIPTRILTKIDLRRKYCVVKKSVPTQKGLYPRQKMSNIPELGKMCGAVRYNF